MVTVQTLSVRNIQYGLEKCYYSLSFLKPATNQSPALDISRDLLTQNLYLNVKENEFFMCAKFIFSAIIYAKVIGNNSFSTGKPLSPRP